MGEEELPGIQYQNGYAVVYLTDDTVGRVDEYIPKMKVGGGQPVVDFTNVSHVPSNTVGKLMSLWSAADRLDLGALILRGLTNRQRRVFVLAGIDKIDSVVLEEAVNDTTH